ncbi:MAG: DUF6263 family protein [Gemmataceae bacterium]
MKRSAVGVGLCVVFGFFVGLPGVDAQEAVTLRYKMNEKEKRVYRRSFEMRQVQEINDRKVKTYMATTDVSEWTLDKIVEKGNFQLQTQNKLYQSTFNVDVGKQFSAKYQYDSKKDENDSTSMFGAALTPLYDALNGAMFKIVVTPQGKINKVKGFAEIIEPIIKKNPLAKQMMGGGEDKGISIFENVFLDLPSKKVSVGDTWNVPYTLKIPQIGKVTGKKLYAFDGFVTKDKRKLAKISLTTEMSIDVDMKNDAGTFKGTLSITDSKGVGYFDPRTGAITSITNQFTMSGDLNATINGQDLTMSQNQKHNYKLQLVK